MYFLDSQNYDPTALNAEYYYSSEVYFLLLFDCKMCFSDFLADSVL
jgi:hypothetical protein